MPHQSISGTFKLEMDRAAVILKAGKSMVEPTYVKMTGYNQSSTDPMRAILFYVSDPDAPFLHPSH